MQVADEYLWEEVKKTVKPVKRRVKRDLPKRLRVVHCAQKRPQTILDLHGLTVQKAFDSTNAFVKSAHRAGLKEIIIITGRGTTGKALIKNEFEGWLENPNISSYIREYQWQNRGGAIKIDLKSKKKLRSL